MDAIDELRKAAQEEHEENLRRDEHNRSCAVEDIKPTTIRALLAYSKAVWDLVKRISWS